MSKKLIFKDARQFPQWGKFLSQIGWIIVNIGHNQAFIKKIPYLGFSIVKFQRPTNPLPLQEIDQLAKQHKALCVVLEPRSENYQEDLLKKSGYMPALNMSLTHTATIHLDLTKSLKELWQSFSENARRNIHKAEKNDLRIEKHFLKEMKDDQIFRTFYDLLLNLHQMKKVFLPGYDEFYKKMLAFKNSSVIFFAYPNTETASTVPIAALWQGFGDNVAVYMHVGMTEKGYQTLANYLLAWEGIKLAKELGMEVYDFEGIHDPRFPDLRKRWKGFSEFKSRFHGRIINYPIPLIKIYNPFFKLFYLCVTIFSKS